MSIKSPEYIERFEYYPIELATPLETILTNNQQQKRTNFEFQVNDLSRPIDWYDSYVKIGFMVNQLANGQDYDVTHNIAPCCGVQSFVKSLSVKANGIPIYKGTMLSVGLFIKNLVTFSKGFAETTAGNMFWHLDQSGDPNSKTNASFGQRSQSILNGRTVQAQLPLNCFSFFDSLNDKILPPMQMNLTFELESDNNILWRAGITPAIAATEENKAQAEVPAVPDGRIIITNFTLWIKKINFNGIGLEKVTKDFFKFYTWQYQLEAVYRSNLLTQHRGEWQITSVFKPRHVFLWFSNRNRDENQERNLFMFDLFKLVSCQLFVGNGESYPECRYEMANKDRMFRQLIEYAAGNNYFDASTQLTPSLWENRYPIIYFDLTYHRSLLDSSAQSLKFVWDLTMDSKTELRYYLNALVLEEKKAMYDSKSNKMTVE